MGLPEAQGLYDPRNEHDACGVGFIADIKGRKSNDIIRQGLQILVNLDHRGAVGADPLLGDGAGILIQTPHEFFFEECLKLGVHLEVDFRLHLLRVHHVLRRGEESKQTLHQFVMQVLQRPKVHRRFQMLVLRPR